jgi:hypothetical protein
VNRFFHPFRRNLLLHALAVLVVLAQTLVVTHRIAHASQLPTAGVTTDAKANIAAWSDLFGHDAGSNCDDWNGAFALDANPDAGHYSVVLAAIDQHVLNGASQHALPATPAGLSRARAPPRA